MQFRKLEAIDWNVAKLLNQYPEKAQPCRERPTAQMDAEFVRCAVNLSTFPWPQQSSLTTSEPFWYDLLAPWYQPFGAMRDQTRSHASLATGAAFSRALYVQSGGLLQYGGWTASVIGRWRTKGKESVRGSCSIALSVRPNAPRSSLVSAWNLHGIGGAYLIVHTPIGSLAASELADLNSLGVGMKVTLRRPRRELGRKESVDAEAV
jgi:hypothetical protein